MYNGVNDENNQGAFNDENSLYHYSYSKDRDPQPGQPDPLAAGVPAGGSGLPGGACGLHHRHLPG